MTNVKRGETMVDVKDKVKDKQETKEKRLTGGLFWTPNINDEIIGTLVAIRQGNYGKDIYDLKTEDKIITIPASAVLESVITDELMDKKLRIKFLGWGKEKSAVQKAGLYRNFDVFLIEE